MVRRNGQVEIKDTIDLRFPIGLISEIGDLVQRIPIELQPGDGAIMFTDGVTEAENESGELYGLERSCTVTGKTWPQVPVEAVKEAIVNDVQDFIGEQIVHDDITQLLKKSEDS